MNPIIPVNFGRVRLSTVSLVDVNPLGMPIYRTTMKYINNLRHKVRIQQRNGLVMDIPPCNYRRNHAGKPGSNELIMVEEVAIGRESYPDAFLFFNTVGLNHSPALQLLRDAFFIVYDRLTPNHSEIKISIDHFVTEEDFNGKGGIFYHQPLDMLMMYGDKEFPYPHPYSPHGMATNMINAMEKEHDDGRFNYYIEIIDNDGKHGDRYQVLNDHVFKIRALKDINKPDGIYIVSTAPAVGIHDNKEIVASRYDFDDAIEKRLGLFKSYPDAMMLGDVALARKKELAEMDHQLALQRQAAIAEKIESDRKKAAIEQEIAEHERLRDQYDREQEMMQARVDEMRRQREHEEEMRRARLKEEMEERSHARKDSSEMLKLLPVILTAIGGILMAWKAFGK